MNLATQDFEAALHEIESNLDVRRLMIVVTNVLVPACLMAMVSAMAGADRPPALAWLPTNVPWIVGVVLTVGGVCTSAILARCHFGLVVNGTKMAKVRDGRLHLAGLNWLGVTTNFVALSAVTAGAGAALVVTALGHPLWAVPYGIALPALMMAMLRWQHGRANRLCATLDASWQHGALPAALRETHARKSLDATSADVSVVVTMGAALFAGTFDAACNLSAADVTVGTLDATTTRTGGVVALMAFTALSLLLTARIVVRLRIALAQHATALAELRSEHDDAWRFDVRERTFLLYLLVALLCAAATLIAAWTAAGRTTGFVAAAVIAAAHLVWYPAQLATARRRT